MAERFVPVFAVSGALLLVAGAIALAYANGSALILDLATSAATFFCL